MKESGEYRMLADIKEAFPKSVSESAFQDAWRQRDTLNTRSREEPGTTRRLRQSTFSDANLELRRRYNICAGLEAVSVTLAGFARRWAKRRNPVNILLWGTGWSAAADLEASRQRMREIWGQL